MTLDELINKLKCLPNSRIKLNSLDTNVFELQISNDAEDLFVHVTTPEEGSETALERTVNLAYSKLIKYMSDALDDEKKFSASRIDRLTNILNTIVK